MRLKFIFGITYFIKIKLYLCHVKQTNDMSNNQNQKEMEKINFIVTILVNERVSAFVFDEKQELDVLRIYWKATQRGAKVRIERVIDGEIRPYEQ